MAATPESLVGCRVRVDGIEGEGIVTEFAKRSSYSPFATSKHTVLYTSGKREVRVRWTAELRCVAMDHDSQ